MVNRKKRAILLLLLLVVAVSLSGCVYGGQIRQQGAPAPGEYVVVVQNAVDQYQKLTQVLPIKTKDMTTPIYEKYPIDFTKLIERGLMSTVPTNAFENGGTASYVLINAETKPQVKLMDLVSYQRMTTLQQAVYDYRTKHSGELPTGDQAYPDWYWLDQKKLGTNESVISPYSRLNLNVVIHKSGIIAIDYGPDIVKLLSKSGGKPADPNVDLRTLLAESGYYVPVRSYAYVWQNNQPVLQPPS